MKGDGLQDIRQSNHMPEEFLPSPPPDEQIIKIFQAHREVYGRPRIHAGWHDQGIHCGRKRVVRLMQQARVSAHCRTHCVVTASTNSQDRMATKDFQAERPNVLFSHSIPPRSSTRSFIRAQLSPGN